MANTVEAAANRHLASVESFDSKQGRLEQEFPGKIVTFPTGSFLYHYSRSVDQLLREGGLDPTRSHNDGAFYFSDVPVQYTNCRVEVISDLVMFRFGELTDQEYGRLNHLGEGNFWAGGMKLGFDGRTFHTADPFVEIKDRQFAFEVVVFPSSLHKLGTVTRFRQRKHT